MKCAAVADDSVEEDNDVCTCVNNTALPSVTVHVVRQQASPSSDPSCGCLSGAFCRLVSYQ